MKRKVKIIRYRKPFLGKRHYAGWLSHEWADGHAVLKGERSWRNVNGVGINAFGGQVWLILTVRPTP